MRARPNKQSVEVDVEEKSDEDFGGTRFRVTILSCT